MDTLDKILYLLKKKGLSDIEFTERLGVNKTTVTEWKKGRTKSYLKKIPDIAVILDVEPDYLLNKNIKCGNAKFAQRIATLRKINEISKVWIAGILDADSNDEYFLWENDGLIPEESKLNHISFVFNVNIDYLLGESDDMQSIRDIPVSSKRMIDLRKSRGLTRLQFKEESKIPDLLIILNEMAINNEPDLSTILSYAKFFNVSFDYLIGRTDEPTFIHKKNEIPLGEESYLSNIWDRAKRLPPDGQKELLEYVSFLMQRYRK